MIKDSVTPEEAIDFLNEALALDPGAVNSLLHNRVRCNPQMADHPTIQVIQQGRDNQPQVGLLGLFNGLFGIDDNGLGVITANVKPNGWIESFEKTERKA